MESLLLDLRLAARELRRTPLFSIIAVGTLAVGIAVTASSFGVIGSLFQQHLPIHNPQSIALLYSFRSGLAGSEQPLTSLADYLDYRERSRSFEGLAALRTDSAVLKGQDEPRWLSVHRVSANIFNVWGVSPILGRAFAADEEGPSGRRVAMLSHRLWQSRFGGSEDVLGREIILDADYYSIVGVLGPRLNRGAWGRGDVWVPLAADPLETSRAERRLMVMGRLRGGVHLDEAQRELRTIAEGLAQVHSNTNSEWSVRLKSLPDATMPQGATATVLTLFTLTVSLVLFVVCANLATLLLARGISREKQFAIRSVVGASRWRILRQLMVESLLIAAIAAGIGALLAMGFVRLVVLVIGPGTQIEVSSTLDSSLLVISIVLAGLATVLFGLLPALRTSKSSTLADQMRSDASLGRHGRGRLGHVLVAAEIAIALVLMVVAVSFAHTASRVMVPHPGIDRESLLSARIRLSLESYPDEHDVLQFFNTSSSALEAIPGVRGVAFVSHLPYTGSPPQVPFISEREGQEVGGARGALYRHVASPDYFRVAGIPLLQGRTFEETDTGEGARVAVVSRTAARRYWPGVNPIGQRFRWAPGSGWRGEWVETVGVVGDVIDARRNQVTAAQVYLPLGQEPVRGISLVVRAEGEPTSVVGPIRTTFRNLHPDQPIGEIRTLADIAGEHSRGVLALVTLFTLLASVAVGLAVAGIYGISDFVARRRTHELGVRVALGARQTQLVRMIAMDGVRVSLIGGTIGLIGSALVAPVLGRLLQAEGSSWPVVTSGLVLVVAVTLAASIIPAIRASAAEPIRSLRVD